MAGSASYRLRSGKGCTSKFAPKQIGLIKMGDWWPSEVSVKDLAVQHFCSKIRRRGILGALAPRPAKRKAKKKRRM